MKYKLAYNDFQSYEDEALVAYLERQREKGWVLHWVFGVFGGIWVFCRDSEKALAEEKYVLYHKHLNPVVDDEISRLKENGENILFQTSQYIVFKVSAREKERSRAIVGISQEEQRGVSVKKALLLTIFLLLLALAASMVGMWRMQNMADTFAVPRQVFSVSMVVCFFLYLIGDCYDYKKGLHTGKKNFFYASERSLLKNILFRIADAVRLGLPAGYLVGSVVCLCKGLDAAALVELVRLWLVFLCVYLVGGIRCQRSYLLCLFLSVCVIIF